MKKVLTLFSLLVACLFVHAQQVSMHSNGHVSTFQKVDTMFLTEYAGQHPLAKTAGTDPTLAGNILPLGRSFGMVTKSMAAAKSAGSRLTTVQKKFTTPFYAYSDGTLQAPTSTLFFKPRNAATVNKDFSRYGVVETHGSFKGYYNLLLNTDIYNDGDKIILLCDSLYEAGLAAVVEPVFVRHGKLNVDPLEPQQWSLNNTGQAGGTPGADMKVSSVWPFGYTGNNVRVAVIDVGVQLNHPDLQANLLTGFDATGNNSGGAPANNAYNTHGTSCAGMIAALRNNIGVVGVAPNARIIPIRLAIAASDLSFDATDEQVVDCFEFAIDNGADIISNSYSIGSPSASIDLAIQDAAQNGRNGLGALVFFATANNDGVVRYPATNASAIAVGASNPCDQRKSPNTCDGESWGSNYGTTLDLVAPGVKITTTTFGTSSYMNNFNGTSAACPNAAGVAALMLSARPASTGAEVRNALERTCDKVGGYTYAANVSGQPNGTWATQTGYGRINAYNAVFALFNMAVNGVSTLCGQATYSFQNLPPNATLQWTATPSTAVTLTPQGNNVLVQGNGGSGSFYLNARVTINGAVYTISRNIVFASYGGPSHISLDPGTQDCLTFGSTRTFYAKDDNGLVCNNVSVAEIEWAVMDYSTTPATIVTNYSRQNCGGILNTSISINLHYNGSPYILSIVCRAKDKCGNWGPWGPGNGYLIRQSCSGFLKAFTLSPNPASSNVMLTLTDDFDLAAKMVAIKAGNGNNSSAKNKTTATGDYTIEVWSNAGRLMKRMTGRGKSVSIPLSGLQQGIYYVNIIKDGITYKDILQVQ